MSCQTSTSTFTMEQELLTTKSNMYKLHDKLDTLTVGTQGWFTDDKKVKFYTGLPNLEILNVVFNFITDAIPNSQRSALSKFQMLSLTLMRLRFNLSVNDLAYRFNISIATVSTIFSKVIDVLFNHLKPMIKWPEREQIWKTTPMCFRKHFGTKIAVIIDCFEIFIQKPKNVLARTQTFSSYKHHNTIKFLIGITTQGVISYISKAWGGRTSDKFLTENCDFLPNLLPGDIVMADRGFDIAESVALYCAEIKIPAFTKGKRQLSSLDVESSRRIASVRIHVERVIGNVRNKYSILQSILPLDYLMKKDGNNFSTIDKMVLTCCGLVNLCDGIIPFE